MLDLIVSVLTFLGSLLAALLTVYYDRKMRDKKKLTSIIDSIIFELARDLSIAKTIISTTDIKVG